jgi:hypothetical protein
MDARRDARAARRLGIAAAIALAVLGAGEVALRAAKLGAPAWHRPDPQLGWSLRPHTRGWHEGVHSRINALGQRDRDHVVQKRAGVYRIAVLGDEYSEALDVPLDKTWWWQLPLALRRCGVDGPERIEVLNFGVAGYGTAQELVLLQSGVMRYEPDLVLLQFSNADDVMDNSPRLAKEKLQPFYGLNADGALRLDERFSKAAEFEARMQFRYALADEIADRSRLLQIARRGVRWIEAAHASETVALEAPRDSAWDEAWRVTEAMIGRMHQYAERNDARFAVLVAPSPAQMAQALDYPEERLSAFGRTHGIPVIALAASMRASARPIYSARGQWTAEGHALAAELAAAALCVTLRPDHRR